MPRASCVSTFRLAAPAARRIRPRNRAMTHREPEASPVVRRAPASCGSREAAAPAPRPRPGRLASNRVARGVRTVNCDAKSATAGSDRCPTRRSRKRKSDDFTAAGAQTDRYGFQSGRCRRSAIERGCAGSAFSNGEACQILIPLPRTNVSNEEYGWRHNPLALHLPSRSIGWCAYDLRRVPSVHSQALDRAREPC